VVAAGAYYAPAAFDIGTQGRIHGASLIEMSIGAAIGAVTFTGSVIAFMKLSGRMSGKPITLPGRHVVNIALFVALIWFIYSFYAGQSQLDFWLIAGISFLFGVLIIIPKRTFVNRRSKTTRYRHTYNSPLLNRLTGPPSVMVRRGSSILAPFDS